MTECVILYRTKSGRIDYIADASDGLAVFPHLDAAIDYCQNHEPFLDGQAVDYQIVELDEL